ncbi:NADPH-dependent ferric siderophore reductase [Curtobacterium luteum]|nr:SIP domain-containing protein [Curtobacterium luteum]MBM7801570.1 NADPH-dependent ferric siderophore reductase [Curtobacterium luteum]NUU52104.1 SIP domain-containing protein [Curtobacterium luteum]
MARTRRQPSERVLVAGSARDLPEIRRQLLELPDDAYGQVFVEVAVDEEVRILPAPPGVAVTWLVRSTRASRVATLAFADHGEVLAEAVTAWAGEWCVVGCEPCTSVWIGCAESAWVERARSVVQLELDDAGQHVEIGG